MTVHEIESEIKALSTSERREIGKFILELERDRLQTELPEDLKRLASVIQTETEKMRQKLMEELEKFKRWQEKK